MSRFQRRTVPASRATRRRCGQWRSRPATGRPAPPVGSQSSASRAAIVSPLFRWELAKMNIQAISRRARLGTAVRGPCRRPRRGRRAGTGRRPAQGIRVGKLSPVEPGAAVGRRRPDAQSAAQCPSVWTSNPDVADVYVNGPRQMNLFGKKAGEATVIATGGRRFGGLRRERPRQPEHQLDQRDPASGDAGSRTSASTTVGQVAVLNGTVASPDDAAQAEMLVKAALNPGIDVTSATPRSTSCRSAV